MTDIINIHVPWWYMPLTVAAVVAAGAAGVARLSGLAHRRFPEEERDWSVPSLAEEGEFSPLHQWDVRCKIVTVLLYSFVVASLTHLEPALAAVGISVVIAVIARAAFSKVMLRLVALAGFSGMLLVIMPFTVPAHPGDTVIVFNGFDWLGFNIRGVILATTIAAKAVAIALLMEPLLATAPLPVTLYGLSRLGVPEMVGQMVLLSHRYVHVVRHEARRMWAGMQVRGFNGRTDPETLRALAGFVGMLFVRSFERTERVSDAMRARGYKGRFPEPADLKFKAADALLATVWLAIGAILTVYDRLIL